jgi:hypothetical protein
MWLQKCYMHKKWTIAMRCAHYNSMSERSSSPHRGDCAFIHTQKSAIDMNQ